MGDLELFALRHLTCPLTFATNYPVAIYSDDHKSPRGTKNDNTRHPRFVRRTEELFEGRPLFHMDLGCAGGGLVLDFLIRGHVSVGVEGSDYSKKECRAEWRVISSHLFTADITEDFRFRDAAGNTARFDVITAWEVLEHIPEDKLPGLFSNVLAHLKPTGLFVASVATFEDKDPATGAVWHVTVKPKEWWIENLERSGLVPIESPFSLRDYVRGSGNPRVGPTGKFDWDAGQNPELGFHIAAMPASAGREAVSRLAAGA